MTIALIVILAAFVLVAFALTVRFHADRVIDELLAVEVRQIDPERKQRQYDANLAARWRG